MVSIFKFINDISHIKYLLVAIFRIKLGLLKLIKTWQILKRERFSDESILLCSAFK